MSERLETEQVRPPAVIVIGEVVAVAEPEFFGRS
jgi:siroheme synthase